MTPAERYTFGDREHIALSLVPCTARRDERHAPPWLTRYDERGFSLVFWSRDPDPTNDWKGPRDPSWPTKAYTPADYREGMQVGVKLGVEIARGRFVVDLDLDWAPGIVHIKHFLPKTGFRFGRKSKPLGHAFYTTATPVTFYKFKDIDGTNLGERRGTKTDGTIGLQTVLPPSMHRESGEVLTMAADGTITHDDAVVEGYTLYMVACLLGRHWPKNGPETNQHDTAAFAAGFLCQRGVDPKRVYTIVEVAATLGGDDNVQDRVRYARDTVAKFEAGQTRLAGGPSLAKEIGEPVVARLREWLPGADVVIENLPTFLQRLAQAPEPKWWIPGLIPDEGTTLWHGQPRDFKTMCALEVGLALAGGRPAFANERFRVARAVPVAYFSEEDPERLVAARLRWLTAKVGVPTEFYPFIRKSLSFDNEDDREFILRMIRETGARVSWFDPVRSYTGLSDKGPAELRPVTVFLRQIQNTTTAKTISLVHHDTKPLAVAAPQGQERSRSQQASGGGIFSISDCPVSFTKLAWNKVAVFPEDYKLSGDPKPFEVTFETDERHSDEYGPRFGSWIRPVAHTKVESDIVEGAAAHKILSFLRSTLGTWHTTGEVDAGAKLRKGTAGPVLKKLYAEGEVLFCEKAEAVALGHNAQAKLWSGRAEQLSLPSDRDRGPEL